MQKFAETRITGANSQQVGDSLRVGGALRGTTRRIRTDVTLPRSNPNRTTVTDQVNAGGVRRLPGAGALNTNINTGNVGGGGITNR